MTMNGMGFTHCWRLYCDYEMQNNNKSAVPLLLFTIKYNLGKSLMFIYIHILVTKEQFEQVKDVIRGHQSKNKQYNVQEKKRQKTRIYLI